MVVPKRSPPRRNPGVISTNGEDAAVERIERAHAERFGGPPAGELWIGDDAAVVRSPSGHLVLAADAVVAGVHADLRWVTLADLGWKAVTSAVSDIGAMGARPLRALVTVCAPPGEDLDLLTAGIADAALEWRCPVVGGDLSTADQVMVSVAVIGELEGPGPGVTRSGASPGDRLLVTGPLGASEAGRRALSAEGAHAELAETAPTQAHRRPRARLAEGRCARSAGASAMIDVSDGLAIDVHRLAQASGVGVELERVPVAPGATEADALGGGEDYELVIAVADERRLGDQFEEAGLERPIVIGVCTGNLGRCELRGEALPPVGWRHDLG